MQKAERVPGRGAASGDDDVPSVLIDLSQVDLKDLTALDKPVLSSALQRIRDEIDHPEEAVAGFQSSL